MIRHCILIVDDDSRVLDGLARVFRKEPYEIVTATSAEGALTILAERSVDIVISDQTMPGMQGTDFLYIVARDYPNTIRYMLTGNPSAEVAIQAINDGAISRFYTKPCHDLDLIITVRHALQQKELAQEAMRLLHEYRKQKARLEKIEAHFPEASGIPDELVTFDVKDLGPQSYDEFIEELRETFGD